jgi:hypothetical protein
MEFIKDVAEQSKLVVKLPSMYNEFITKNASAVGQVEGALRSLTYLIPGRTTLNQWSLRQECAVDLTTSQAPFKHPILHPSR